MEGKDHRFPKSGRLHLRKEIEQLFIGGKHIRSYPLNLIFSVHPGNGKNMKMGVSVPKRLVKLAVNRNKIKRQIREIYRQHCHPAKAYFTEKNLSVHLMIVFNGKESPDFSLLESKIILILQRLVKEHEVATG